MKLLNRLSKFSNSDIGSKITVTILEFCIFSSVILSGMIFYYVIPELVSIPLFLCATFGLIILVFVGLYPIHEK